MKITQKLVLGFLAVSVFSAIVGYVGLVGLRVVDGSFAALSSQSIPMINILKDLKIISLQVFSATVESSLIPEAMRDTEHSGDEAHLREVKKEEFNKEFDSYSLMVDRYFPDEAAYRDNIREKWLKLSGISENMAELRARNASFGEILEADGELEEASKEVWAAIDTVIGHEMAEIEERRNIIGSTMDKSFVSIMVIVIVSVFSAAVSGFIFSRSIAEPVMELARASAGMKGDYSGAKKVKFAPGDEIGDLAGTFNQMVDDIKRRDEALLIKNKDLEKSKKDLESKVAELVRFNKLTVGRELKMIELKKRIKELEGKK